MLTKDQARLWERWSRATVTINLHACVKLENGMWCQLLIPCTWTGGKKHAREWQKVGDADFRLRVLVMEYIYYQCGVHVEKLLLSVVKLAEVTPDIKQNGILIF